MCIISVFSSITEIFAFLKLVTFKIMRYDGIKSCEGHMQVADPCVILYEMW